MKKRTKIIISLALAIVVVSLMKRSSETVKSDQAVVASNVWGTSEAQGRKVETITFVIEPKFAATPENVPTTNNHRPLHPISR